MPPLQLTFDRAPRFVLLLLSIIAELMLAPLFAGTEFGLHAAQVLASLVMGGALWAAGAQPASVLLFVSAIVTHLLAVYWGAAPMRVAALTLRILFFSYATGLIMWRTLRRPDVTIDTIAGAACAYTLLALVWGNIYVLLESPPPRVLPYPRCLADGPLRRSGRGARLLQLRHLDDRGLWGHHARVARCRGSGSGGGRRGPTLSRGNDRPAGWLAHLAAQLTMPLRRLYRSVPKLKV